MFKFTVIYGKDFYLLFSSPDPKGHVSYCHHLASVSPDPKGHVGYCHHLESVVVIHRKLFQKSSPLKVLDQLKANLSESSIGCLV